MTLLDRAIDHHRAGRLDLAAEAMRQVVAQQPHMEAHALTLLALLINLGRFEDAVAAGETALGHHPNNLPLLIHLGQAQIGAGAWAGAEASLRKAMQLSPSDWAVRLRLACALNAQGRGAVEAVELVAPLAVAAADQAFVRYQHGWALANAGRVDEAVAEFQVVLLMDPNHADALLRLSSALLEAGDPAAALLHADRLLGLNPSAESRASAEFARSMALVTLGRHDEALEASHKSHKPDSLFTGRVAPMLALYHPGLTPQRVFEIHRDFSAVVTSGLRPAMIGDITARRLRIGYLSRDFRKHSVAYFIKPVLRAHRRDRVEVFAYSDVPNPDAVTAELRALVEDPSHRDSQSPGGWRDISTLDIESAARLIREDRIDILIDLGGLTGLADRIALFGLRPAPIQATWLGYPATTGMGCMDWRIVDSLTDPPGLSDSLHTEKLMRLTPPFLCFEPAPGWEERPGRTPNAPVIFGSFNQAMKINAEVCGVWARVLLGSPCSRLLLKFRGATRPPVQRMMLDRFAAHGVQEDRIIFRDYELAPGDHMRAFHLADVLLDPFPYSGTTTTCEALWMGLPVVSLMGSAHVSRVSVMILSTIGLPELAAESVDDYVKIAAGLAADTARLADLQNGMRRRMMESSLMDAAGFVEKLEAAYLQMAVATGCAA